MRVVCNESQWSAGAVASATLRPGRQLNGLGNHSLDRKADASNNGGIVLHATSP